MHPFPARSPGWPGRSPEPRSSGGPSDARTGGEMSAAVQMEAICKSFDRKPALDGAWFAAEYGRLHALLGENGAGKTTLMNVLCGLYAPDRGRIAVDGRDIRLEGPAHARRLGIGMVHQNFKLVHPFTVAENVMLANPGRSWAGGLRAARSGIERYCRELGFDLDPDAEIDSLSVAERQRVEIVKLLVAGARLLVLDEPTAVLTDDEADRVLGMMRDLARRGSCVVLITHKLREVLDYADHVTVMRGGGTVASESPAGMSRERLTELMVGAAPPDETAPAVAAGAVRLEVRELTATRGDGVRTVDGLSVSVRAGQIYGIAGVGGNGQAELAEILLGVRAAEGGSIITNV